MTDKFFPYEIVRPVQDEFMGIIRGCCAKKKHAVLHAPTGIGKTVASLAPALEYAIEHDKIILFLTSRHTQHAMAIRTLKDIQEKHGASFGVVDLIAKQKMCLVKNTKGLSSTDFSQFCKEARERRTCKYYKATRKSDSVPTDEADEAAKILRGRIHSTEELCALAYKNRLCPYELAMIAAQEARVIIGDYYYMFHESIQAPFFARIQRDLDDAIVIVDEAHNLPRRIKDLASTQLSSFSLRRAITEADKEEHEDVLGVLQEMHSAFEAFIDAEDPEQQQLVGQDFFNRMIEEIGDYDLIAKNLLETGVAILKDKKRSSVLNVAHFMYEWQKEQEGFARILSFDMGRQSPIIALSNRCLDPAVVSADPIARAHSVLMMSGTLLPTRMYGDLLGMDPDRTIYHSFCNPFPKHNALHWVVPDTTTKYAHRGEEQYRRIAGYISDIVGRIPGNTAVFFPSYRLRDSIAEYLDVEKEMLFERPDFSKEEKEQFLLSFKSKKETGALLLGATSGSFGEGVDLPGDLLTCVIIVGLPLARPDVETQQLISYYDRKFGKGWDYGYIYPAFNMTLQNAGRCIRSEKDHGIIVYLDERYTWRNYAKCFPEDLNMVVTTKTQVVDLFLESQE